MKVLEEKKKTITVDIETPATWHDGSVDHKKVKIIEKVTVELNGNEFEKLKIILSLNDTQYKKFLRKFKLL